MNTHLNFKFDRMRQAECFIVYLAVITPLLSFRISHFIQVEENILTVIVIAASFIAATTFGVLINSYFYIQKLKISKIDRFAKLQNELKVYANAFYYLVEDLKQKHTLDYQLQKSIKELECDEKWSINNEDSLAVLFVRYLREIGNNNHKIPDVELDQAIIKEKELEQMRDCITRANGLLSRYKHFKHILKSFKLKDTQNLDKVIITNSEQIKFWAKKNKKSGNYQTLEYWMEQISDCEELLSRMIANGRFIYRFKTIGIQKLGLILLFLTIFGILLPIIILMLNDIIQQYQSFLLITSAIGLMLYFILAIITICRKLSSP